jgi:hypothetical protein
VSLIDHSLIPHTKIKTEIIQLMASETHLVASGSGTGIYVNENNLSLLRHDDDCDVIADEIWFEPTPRSVTLASSSVETPPYFHESIPTSTCVGEIMCYPDGGKHKCVNSKDMTKRLQHWITFFPRPYATIDDKKAIATVLGIKHAQVTTFCNNYRKRYGKKVGGVIQSYTQSSRTG